MEMADDVLVVKVRRDVLEYVLAALDEQDGICSADCPLADRCNPDAEDGMPCEGVLDALDVVGVSA